MDGRRPARPRFVPPFGARCEYLRRLRGFGAFSDRLVHMQQAGLLALFEQVDVLPPVRAAVPRQPEVELVVQRVDARFRTAQTPESASPGVK